MELTYSPLLLSQNRTRPAISSEALEKVHRGKLRLVYSTPLGYQLERAGTRKVITSYTASRVDHKQKTICQNHRDVSGHIR